VYVTTSTTNRRVATQAAYFHKWVSITGHNKVHDLTHERGGSSESSFGVARPHTFMRSIFPRSSSSSRFYNTPTELSERLSHTHTYINTQTINSNFNSTCLLHVNHPQLLRKYIYLYFCYWSSEVNYICRCNMYFCKNTSLLTGGSSTHKTSVGARTVKVGIVRFKF